MENAQECRAIALLCRQQASIHPQDSWKWLAQAERWEHLAEMELSSQAEESKLAGSGDLARAGVIFSANDVAAYSGLSNSTPVSPVTVSPFVPKCKSRVPLGSKRANATSVKPKYVEPATTRSPLLWTTRALAESSPPEKSTSTLPVELNEVSKLPSA